jgi:hypothetical protein
MLDRLRDFIPLLDELLNAVPFLIFLAFWVLGPLFKKASRDASPPKPTPRPSPTLERAPGPRPTTTSRPMRTPLSAPTSQWGGAFDRTQQSRDDEALEWGSAFSERDELGEKLKWGSAFDAEREETRWGFDETDWGSGFGPKKQSEPKITVG